MLCSRLSTARQARLRHDGWCQGAIGFASGGAGAYAGGIASTAGRVAAMAAIGGTSGAASTVTQRGVEAAFYGASMDPADVLEDAAISFGTGAALSGGGAAAGAFFPATSHILEPVEGSLELGAMPSRAVLKSASLNAWPDLDKQIAKVFGKSLLKPGGNMLWWTANDLGWVGVVKRQGPQTLGIMFHAMLAPPSKPSTGFDKSWRGGGGGGSVYG